MKSKPKSNESPKLILRVPPEVLEDLKARAAADRRKLSDYVRLILIDHLAGKKGR